MKTLKLKKDVVGQLSTSQVKHLYGGGTYPNSIEASVCILTLFMSCDSCTSCGDVSCNDSCEMTCRITDPATGASCVDASCLPPCKEITVTGPGQFSVNSCFRTC